MAHYRNIVFQILVFLTLGIAAGSTKADMLCTQQGGCNYVPSQSSRVMEWIWEERYGALAVDQTKGSRILGTAAGRPDQQKAEQKALKDCEKQGGQKCEIVLNYANQCVAVAFTAKRDLFYDHGDTKKSAKQAVMASCPSADQCQVVYADCSKPYHKPVGFRYE